MSAMPSKRMKRAVDSLQQIVDEWPKAFPDHVITPRIVWGWGDKELEDDDSVPALFQQTAALLGYANDDFEVTLILSGDAEYPDCCDIRIDFKRCAEGDEDRQPELPVGDVRKLFNVMSCCKHNVQFDLYPADVENDPEIVVTGMSTRIPVETLTPRILNDALSRLRGSRDLVWGWLTKNEGDDHWSDYVADDDSFDNYE